ncbi:SRPBCC family protein [Micromonospora rosaria]|uniref:SRPBCC family protein n=1 Tax=Micromonospora rosaria TaxID=47874 RepID=UPI0008364CD0|nr:SRPBCC family protein [Micromonospora rosaria]
MIEVHRTIRTSSERVFAVLADGWSYASWVVGAAHIRAVDAGWPAVGAQVHHRLGPWPLQVNDRTVVREMEPNRILELEAHAGPLGIARVRLTLERVSDTTTCVRMGWMAVSGAARFLPKALMSLLLRPRNAETLHRVEDLAVHREFTQSHDLGAAAGTHRDHPPVGSRQPIAGRGERRR